MDLGVTVLASLRGGHIDDFAGAALDNDKAVLSEGRALHREGLRGASADLAEVMLMLLREHKLVAIHVQKRKKEGERSKSRVATAVIGWAQRTPHESKVQE
jgi:hypothetical protein